MGILWALILLGVIILFILLEILLAYIASVKLARPPREMGGWNPGDLGLQYTSIDVVTRDNTRLKGWLIKGGKASTIIVLHGYTASKYNETYIKPVVKLLSDEGYNILVYDQRGHGESEEAYTTLGYREVDDLKDVIEWLRRSHPEIAGKIGVIGYSMGGAVVLMYATKYGGVDAYIADSPYIDVFESGKRWIKRSKEPLRSMLLLVFPLIVKFTEGRVRVKSEELRLYKYAKTLKDNRILVIIGGRDDLVDVSEVTRFVEEARQAGAEVELWITDSMHVRSIITNPGEYREKVIGFLERCGL
ncbi:alpha/beta hydrolase [Desulfurococcus amylolyticus]|uniref:alpha/beta hydrolase n=1 Tax=Desulfurococcus amylolyticus TaxID=94694 RepID=UPI0023F4BEDC|nr:alpha/beta fold hydrolase [Desulfurococcus amylolyticus]